MCRHLRPQNTPPGPPLIHQHRASAFPLALAPFFPHYQPPRASPAHLPPCTLRGAVRWHRGGAEKGDAKAGTSLTQGPGDVTVSPAVGTASIQLHASGPARFPAMDFFASLPFPGCHPQGAPMVISSPRHLPFSLTPPLPRDDFKRSANELPAR